MIPISEAWRRLLPHCPPLPPVTLSRPDAAGRTLAAVLSATVDVPFADVSAMDGYALAGPLEPGERRRVTGTVAAGDQPGLEIAAGDVARIMTGAPVPAGADRIVPVEHTDGGAEQVTIERPTQVGAHVRRRGEVIATGAPLLAAGARLTPGALSLLATHGIAEVAVVGAPRVALLVTGDEVVAPHRTPGPGQLRDSHTDFLLAAGRTLGLAFEPLGIAGDDEIVLRRAVERGLGHDVLLLTGGVSMGEFDLVERVLRELDFTTLFDAVAMQPGKPLVAATRPGGPLVFGLPGNPASVMVAFWLFVAGALRRMMGEAVEDPLARLVAARCRDEQPPAKGRDRFLPCSVAAEEGQLVASTHPPRGSHDLVAFAFGNALLRVPAGAESRVAGSPCEVLSLF